MKHLVTKEGDDGDAAAPGGDEDGARSVEEILQDAAARVEEAAGDGGAWSAEEILAREREVARDGLDAAGVEALRDQLSRATRVADVVRAASDETASSDSGGAAAASGADAAAEGAFLERADQTMSTAEAAFQELRSTFLGYAERASESRPAAPVMTKEEALEAVLRFEEASAEEALKREEEALRAQIARRDAAAADVARKKAAREREGRPRSRGEACAAAVDALPKAPPRRPGSRSPTRPAQPRRPAAASPRRVATPP